MGSQKKYTERTLKTAVKKYFDSISREVTLTEQQTTGKKDKYGHMIYKPVPLTNKKGEPVKVTEYLVPPTLGGLCIFLKIHNSTWSRWKDANKHPEFQEIIEATETRLLTWRQEQVLIRKNVKGLIWDMETNYGCGKQEQKPAGDDEPRHGIVILPAINALTPPPDEEDISDG